MTSRVPGATHGARHAHVPPFWEDHLGAPCNPHGARQEPEGNVAKYLISFPSGAMQLTPEQFEQAGIDSHRVVQEAKDAGVWVFGGGIDEDVPTLMVDADGSATEGTYPETARIEGGYSVLECADDATALYWASRIADACKCKQELRKFMYDPES